MTIPVLHLKNGHPRTLADNVAFDDQGVTRDLRTVLDEAVQRLSGVSETWGMAPDYRRLQRLPLESTGVDSTEKPYLSYAQCVAPETGIICTAFFGKVAITNCIKVNGRLALSQFRVSSGNSVVLNGFVPVMKGAVVRAGHCELTTVPGAFDTYFDPDQSSFLFIPCDVAGIAVDRIGDLTSLPRGEAPSASFDSGALNLAVPVGGHGGPYLSLGEIRNLPPGSAPQLVNAGSGNHTIMEVSMPLMGQDILSPTPVEYATEVENGVVGTEIASGYKSWSYTLTEDSIAGFAVMCAQNLGFGILIYLNGKQISSGYSQLRPGRLYCILPNSHVIRFRAGDRLSAILFSMYYGDVDGRYMSTVSGIAWPVTSL